jgi:hypothetical protein
MMVYFNVHVTDILDTIHSLKLKDPQRFFSGYQPRQHPDAADSPRRCYYIVSPRKL